MMPIVAPIIIKVAEWRLFVGRISLQCSGSVLNEDGVLFVLLESIIFDDNSGADDDKTNEGGEFVVDDDNDDSGVSFCIIIDADVSGIFDVKNDLLLRFSDTLYKDDLLSNKSLINTFFVGAETTADVDDNDDDVVVVSNLILFFIVIG